MTFSIYQPTTITQKSNMILQIFTFLKVSTVTINNNYQLLKGPATSFQFSQKQVWSISLKFEQYLINFITIIPNILKKQLKVWLLISSFYYDVIVNFEVGQFTKNKNLKILRIIIFFFKQETLFIIC